MYEVAADTRKGYVPYNRNKVNQDRPLIKFDLKGKDDMALFGVMDGHGEFGHEVSSMVQNRLPALLEDEQELSDNLHDSVNSAVAVRRRVGYARPFPINDVACILRPCIWPSLGLCLPLNVFSVHEFRTSAKLNPEHEFTLQQTLEQRSDRTSEPTSD